MNYRLLLKEIICEILRKMGYVEMADDLTKISSDVYNKELDRVAKKQAGF